MSTRVEAASSMPDVLKWIAAAALFAAGLIGFYIFAEHSTLLRVVGLLFALLMIFFPLHFPNGFFLCLAKLAYFSPIFLYL